MISIAIAAPAMKPTIPFLNALSDSGLVASFGYSITFTEPPSKTCAILEGAFLRILFVIR